MSQTELVQSCAEAVVSDVTATTDLRIEVTHWVAGDPSIGAVVHEVGTTPKSPVWEAVGCLGSGDSLALHPPSRADEYFVGQGDRTDVTMTIADAVQQLVQVLLWQRGLDPTWPACSAHHGRHPLRVDSRSVTTTTTNGHPTIESDTGARWTCPLGTTSIVIGDLVSPPEL